MDVNVWFVQDWTLLCSLVIQDQSIANAENLFITPNNNFLIQIDRRGHCCFWNIQDSSINVQLSYSNKNKIDCAYLCPPGAEDKKKIKDSLWINDTKLSNVDNWNLLSRTKVDSYSIESVNKQVITSDSKAQFVFYKKHDNQFVKKDIENPNEIEQIIRTNGEVV